MGWFQRKSKAWSQEEAASHLNRCLNRSIKKIGHQTGIQVLVNVESQKFTFRYAGGTASSSSPAPATIDQPFHIASIGKVFTAVLIGMLADRGRLAFSDSAARFFSPAELNRLFVYQGRDYSDKATVEQLLGHTSGIADYFEGPVLSGPLFLRRVLSNPDEHWTPDKLVDFTREHQQAVGVPGTVFHYSDTGYLLLGQIIERVTGQSFHDNLHDHIFRPLGMDDSYLLFYSEPHRQPHQPIQDIWINKVECSRFRSLSCDWAGGGIVSTAGDLYRFQRALRKGELLQADTLRKFDAFDNRFRRGIRYGLGMMEIRFDEMLFLLKGWPRLKGHLGIVATHMLYDPVHDAHVIMNFGSSALMEHSFRVLFQIMNTIKRLG